MRVDPTGYEWWHWAIGAVIVVAVVAMSIVTVGIGTTIVAALVGAAVSVTGKYVEDVVYNVASGKTGLDIFKPVSTWQDYLSAAVTGAVMGMMTAMAPGFGNKLAGKLFDATLRPFLTQTFELASGARTEYKILDMATSAGIRFATSFLKIKGGGNGVKMLPNPLITQAQSIISGAPIKMLQNLSVNYIRGVIKSLREKYNF